MLELLSLMLTTVLAWVRPRHDLVLENLLLSPYVMRVVAQERAPGLARRAPPSAPAITPNRSIADDDAQLEQLASDPLSTPESVVAAIWSDQVPHLGAKMRTAAATARLPPPEEA